jgi:SAM-dependent methyltransferase
MSPKPEELDEPRAANLRNWESRVPVHAASRTYDLDGLVAGQKRLSDVVAFDEPHLGDLTGRDVVHLQCHIGTDTLSLARLGARVTGLDFSPAALAVARDITVRAGLDVTFVESELYGAVDALGAGRFDLVYTGIGALCWLPDVRRWAATVAALLRPGGRLYLREGHPVLWATEELGPDRFELRYPYFETAPTRFDEPWTYTDGEQLAAPVTYQWNHGLGEIVQAVLDAGMVLTRLVEHDEVDWPAYPWFVECGNGRFKVPSGEARVPLEYTLEARQPGGDG